MNKVEEVEEVNETLYEMVNRVALEVQNESPNCACAKGQRCEVHRSREDYRPEEGGNTL